jgi:hypothetical protein
LIFGGVVCSGEKIRAFNRRERREQSRWGRDQNDNSSAEGKGLLTEGNKENEAIQEAKNVFLMNSPPSPLFAPVKNPLSLSYLR